MRLSCLLFLNVLASLIDHTPKNIYSIDPKKEVYHLYKSDEVVIYKNAEWLDRLKHNPKQNDFVVKMINIPDTVPLTPDNTMKFVDNSPFCWAILVYNSNHDELFEETVELGNAIAAHFHSRVAVAMLDLGYPSNFATFGDLFSNDVPAILIKRPETIHAMFHSDDIDTEMIHLKLDDLSQWGEIISKEQLVKTPEESIEKIDKIYAESHDSYKLGPVFLEHYNITDDNDSRKEHMRIIYAKFMEGIHKHVVEEARKLGLHKFLTDPALQDLDMATRQSEGEKLYNFMKIKTDVMMKSVNVSEIVHKKFQMILDKHNAHEKYPHVDLIPPTPTEIKSKIPKWLDLRNEL